MKIGLVIKSNDIIIFFMNEVYFFKLYMKWMKFSESRVQWHKICKRALGTFEEYIWTLTWHKMYKILSILSLNPQFKDNFLVKASLKFIKASTLANIQLLY